MATLQELLSAAEIAAGHAYAALVGTYQDINAWTAEHPEVLKAARVAADILRLAGVDISPEIDMAPLVWGRIGALLAVDPTVQGPRIAAQHAERAAGAAAGAA
jgi:hypothetical protein